MLLILFYGRVDCFADEGYSKIHVVAGLIWLDDELAQRLQVVSEQDINHFKTALSRCQKSGSSNRAGKSFEEFFSGYAK